MKLDFTLRPAQKQDWLAIHWLIWRVHINPVGLAWQRFVVAVDSNGHVIGCGQIKPHPGGLKELASLAVTPALQHHGVGKTLVVRLMAGQKPPLYLMTHRRRETYYHQFGFYTLPGDQIPADFKAMRMVLNGASRLFQTGSPVRSEVLCVMRWDGPAG
jgi:N-acetylglutamate synthase-like GNAT family acetyltransferase